MASRSQEQCLVETVKLSLAMEHNWTHLVDHHKRLDDTAPLLKRPIISGLPPKRLYIHPNEQIDIIKNQLGTEFPIQLAPEVEWVVPLHISESTSIATIASLFTSLSNCEDGTKPKHLLMAMVHNDSTVIYYIVHNALVKPRQN